MNTKSKICEHSKLKKTITPIKQIINFLYLNIIIVIKWMLKKNTTGNGLGQFPQKLHLDQLIK